MYNVDLNILAVVLIDLHVSKNRKLVFSFIIPLLSLLSDRGRTRKFPGRIGQ
jgi:hypothetical protein